MDYAKLSHITTKEIEIDIADTEREINHSRDQLMILRKEREGNSFKISIIEFVISLREEFLKYLTKLLAWRKENN